MSEDRKSQSKSLHQEYQEMSLQKSEVKIEGGVIPFDLSALFTLNYSFETLQKVIEWLASEQRGLKSAFANMKPEVTLNMFLELQTIVMSNDEKNKSDH